MMLMALVSWWYGAGWARLAHRCSARIDNTLSFFSVGLLARTLFDPFRQIDAGSVRGPVAVQFRAWFDRLFSRGIGFFVRSTVIWFGLSIVAVQAVGAVLQLILWPLMPVLPVIGIVLFIFGVAA